MTRVRYPLATMALAAALASLSPELYAADKPHSMNEGFNIPPQEFPQLEHDALLGSGEAAYKLSQYAYFVALNEEQGIHWLRVAAEDGNATAEFGLAARLRDGHEPQDKLRACFWLARAKANGSAQVVTMASRMLSELDSSCAAP
jgi:TPR repeat protein